MENRKKIAWVLSEDVSYLRFLKEYVQERGFVARDFFDATDCMNYILKNGHIPDFMILGGTLGTEGKRIISQLHMMNPSLDIVELSLIRMMALAQSEIAEETVLFHYSEKQTPFQRLSRKLGMINLLNL